MNKDRIGPALGKIASGLYIATAVVNGGPAGMLCSFVEQAGFAPPMSPALEDGGVFGLHVLGRNNGALMKAFARGDNPGAFSEFPLVENEHGVPQFADALAFLLCRVVGSIEAGDHILHLAEVLDGALQSGDEEPSIRVRANGFGY
jgi:3-hydroxy-9,10-secoandrosta-1,3,5(10)-triene-9,17-dione monooxygenase reductase component